MSNACLIFQTAFHACSSKDNTVAGQCLLKIKIQKWYLFIFVSIYLTIKAPAFIYVFRSPK